MNTPLIPALIQALMIWSVAIAVGVGIFKGVQAQKKAAKDLRARIEQLVAVDAAFTNPDDKKLKGPLVPLAMYVVELDGGRLVHAVRSLDDYPLPRWKFLHEFYDVPPTANIRRVIRRSNPHLESAYEELLRTTGKD